MATEVLVPPLGQTVDTVTLVAWYKKEGEAVEQGEMLFAIETDKATMDVEAPAGGVLRRVTAGPGDEVQVLNAIALIAAPDEVITEAKVLAGSKSDLWDGLAKVDRTPAGKKKGHGRRDRIFISPRARRLAEGHDIPLTELQATGPEGAIVERDVRAYLDRQATPSITPVARRMAEEAGLEWRTMTGSGAGGRIVGEDISRLLAASTAAESKPAISAIAAEASEPGTLEIIPLRSTRAVIAERMLQSASTTAPVTLTAEVDATTLVGLRRQLLDAGVAVSYNDLFLSILARALRDHPRLNASIEGEVIKVWQRIDIGLATETQRGLLVPVVRNVDGKGLAQLAGETAALIKRARAGQCSPEELRGGTFTLTNLGMFGIDAFTPLINLPECAILGVGRIKQQPVMSGEVVVSRQMVWLSLTFDHRLLDGVPAARFLQRVGQLVEQPYLLLS
jgi:pyruvate dehydrogenase E2 component (dihydrolipoamide acetyltransferase)